MTRFLIILIVAVWVMAIAIVAAQNGTFVSLQFLWLRSVPLPFGLLLAFCAALGMIGTTILLCLGNMGSRRRSSRYGDDF